MSVLDLINAAEADKAAADKAATAALAADKDAQAAADKAKESTLAEAKTLHAKGLHYVQRANGEVVTYDSQDGINIQISTPKNAATTAADEPAPAPPAGPANPAAV